MKQNISSKSLSNPSITYVDNTTKVSNIIDILVDSSSIASTNETQEIKNVDGTVENKPININKQTLNLKFKVIVFEDIEKIIEVLNDGIENKNKITALEQSLSNTKDRQAKYTINIIDKFYGSFKNIKVAQWNTAQNDSEIGYATFVVSFYINSYVPLSTPFIVPKVKQVEDNPLTKIVKFLTQQLAKVKEIENSINAKLDKIQDTINTVKAGIGVIIELKKTIDRVKSRIFGIIQQGQLLPTIFVSSVKSFADLFDTPDDLFFNINKLFEKKKDYAPTESIIENSSNAVENNLTDMYNLAVLEVMADKIIQAPFQSKDDAIKIYDMVSVAIDGIDVNKDNLLIYKQDLLTYINTSFPLELKEVEVENIDVFNYITKFYGNTDYYNYIVDFNNIIDTTSYTGTLKII